MIQLWYLCPVDRNACWFNAYKSHWFWDDHWVTIISQHSPGCILWMHHGISTQEQIFWALSRLQTGYMMATRRINTGDSWTHGKSSSQGRSCAKKRFFKKQDSSASMAAALSLVMCSIDWFLVTAMVASLHWQVVLSVGNGRMMRVSCHLSVWAKRNWPEYQVYVHSSIFLE